MYTILIFILFCSINLFPFTLCIKVLTCGLPLQSFILSKSEIVKYFILCLYRDTRRRYHWHYIFVFLFSSSQASAFSFSTHFSDIQPIEQRIQNIENDYYFDVRCPVYEIKCVNFVSQFEASCGNIEWEKMSIKETKNSQTMMIIWNERENKSVTS